MGYLFLALSCSIKFASGGGRGGGLRFNPAVAMSEPKDQRNRFASYFCLAPPGFDLLQFSLDYIRQRCL